MVDTVHTPERTDTVKAFNASSTKERLKLLYLIHFPSVGHH